jgi:HlyD family secretion protein
MAPESPPTGERGPQLNSKGREPNPTDFLSTPVGRNNRLPVDPTSEVPKSFIPGWLVAIATVGAVVTGGISLYTLLQFNPLSDNRPTVGTDSKTRTTQMYTVSALGRLEPEGEIVQLTAPMSFEGERLEKLLVEEGDRVRKNQAIAIMDSRNRLTAALDIAKQQVQIAQAQLGQVRAGAKAGDIAAQEAAIARLNAQLPTEIAAQQATISRLEAQLQGDLSAQQATISRLEAQLQEDRVAQNAQIARLEAQFQGDVTAARATLDRLRAELQGRIAAQTTTVARLEAQLRNASAEYQRYQNLYREGVVSESLFDSKRLDLETSLQEVKEAYAILDEIRATGDKQLEEASANLQRLEVTGRKQIEEAKAALARIEATGREQLNEARAILEQIRSTGREQIAESRVNLDRIVVTREQDKKQAESTLESIAEVRTVDVQAAQAEVDRAIAGVKEAQARLDEAYVRSPIDGRVMTIHTRPGETVGDLGIVELGRTDRMYAVAEVYETDIKNVRVGQRATISSDAFEGELQGTVETVGLKIGKKDILDTDPAADVDVRVIEVKIRLDPEHSDRVASLTNLQVSVEIATLAPQEN